MQADTHSEELTRRVHPSWLIPILCWVAAGGSTAIAYLLQSTRVAEHLLVGPFDQHRLQFLAMAAALGGVAVAVVVTVHTLARHVPDLTTRVVADLVTSCVVVAVLLAAWPAVLLGSLAFSSEYRVVGAVEGHEVVVEQRIGLGQFPLRAGLRNGPFVDFTRSRGDDWTDGNHPLDDLRFRIGDEAGTVLLTYTPGPTPDRPTGELRILPSPRAGGAGGCSGRAPRGTIAA